MSKQIFIFLGGSASGKTTGEQTLINLEDFNFASIISDATFEEVEKVIDGKKVKVLEGRPPRVGEIDGVHYNFMDLKTYLKKEHAVRIKITKNWRYGVDSKILKENKDKDLIYSVINVKPAVDLIKYVKRNKLNYEIKIIYFNIKKEKRAEKIKETRPNELLENILKRFDNEDSPEVVLKALKEVDMKPILEITDYFNNEEELANAIMNVFNETVKKTKKPSTKKIKFPN